METTHKMMSLSLAAAAALMVTGVSALAAPPASVANTTWTVQANQNVEQLVITTQAGPGAPSNETCRGISGKIGIAPIDGWYCPGSGRIHILHQNLHSRLTMRVFTGNVSDEIVGQPLYIGGTMMTDYAAFGSLGESNFSAVSLP